MSTSLFLAPSQQLAIPRGLIVPQASPETIIATARLLHESQGDLTSEQIAEMLDRSPRTARYAMAAAGAMGAARVRMMPSPRRMVAATAFAQRHAFSVANQTVTNMKTNPFVSAFSSLGAHPIERTLREYGLHGQTITRRVRAIGSISDYVSDYTPEYIAPTDFTVLDGPSTSVAQRPVRKGKWAETGRPSARLVGGGFEIPVARVDGKRGAPSTLVSINDPILNATATAALVANTCPDCHMVYAASGACLC